MTSELATNEKQELLRVHTSPKGNSVRINSPYPESESGVIIIIILFVHKTVS